MNPTIKLIMVARTMKNHLCRTAQVILLLLACTCSFSGQASELYPKNPVERPLILPQGVGEMTIGPAFLNGNERENMQPVVNLRYALRTDLELTILGIRYRFLNTPNYQWLAEIQNFGINNKLNHHTLIGVHGKQIFTSRLALEYRLGAYLADSHEKDGKTHEIRPSIKLIQKLSDNSAIEALYARRYLSGFNQTQANLFKMNLIYTFHPNIEVIAGYGYSDFNKAVDSVLFNESYNNRYDILIRWRFKAGG